MKSIENIKIHMVLLVVFLQGFILLHGQSFSDNVTQIREIPTTPTMWEFEKYGTYPVSMHTGVPDISIPLYMAKSGKVEVPISLSYHASGIKVDQKASWVGLGWSLMAGGAITRTIRGGVDERNKGFINYNFHDEGTFDPAESNNYDKTEDMIIGSIDTEPDVFQYRFMGYSGRFVFKAATGTSAPVIALIPHNDLKIKPVFVNNSLNSFTITTPEGYVAEFAYTENSREYRSGLDKTLIVSATTAWHLKKITAPNGVDEITFQYRTLEAFMDERYSEVKSVPFNDCNNNLPGSVTLRKSNNSIHFSSIKRLERIDFNNGYVLFESSLGNRLDDSRDEDVRLDAIKVYTWINGKYALNKTFELDYGYFGSINAANDVLDDREVRLKLRKVTEKGSQGTSKSPYEFTYQEKVNGHGMPYRFSNSQDYWGYYNGISNPSLVPAYTYEYFKFSWQQISLGDADRNVNGTHLYAAIGIIDRITYPTSGYTEFEFENNRVTVSISGSQQQKLAGGLRIKSIKSYHYNDILQWQKSYEYTKKNNPSLSSGVYNGVNFIKPRDYFNSRSYHFNRTNGYGNCHPNPFRNYVNMTVSMASTPRLVNNYGSVFYSHVKEYNGSPTNYQGYIWHQFDATKDTFVQGIGPVAFPIDRSWDRGQLVLEETYKNGRSNPIKRVEYHYEEINVTSPVQGYKPGTRHDVTALGYYDPGGPTPSEIETYRSNQYFLTYYEEPIVWKRLQSKTTEQDGLEVTETYSYNTSKRHTNPTSITSITSSGHTRNQKTYYPDDVTSVSRMEGPDVGDIAYTAISKLKWNGTNRRVGQPIQTTTIENDEVSIERTNFRDWGGIINPENIETLKGDYSTSNPIQQRVVYHDYDGIGKPLQISKVGGKYLNYLWGYNKEYVIAMIESELTYDEIDTALFNAESFNFSTIQTKSNEDDDNCPYITCKEEILREHLNAIRDNFPEAMVTTYTYDPLVGVTSITDPRGNKTRFVYDEFNRLKEVRDDKGNLVTDYKYDYAAEE